MRSPKTAMAMLVQEPVIRCFTSENPCVTEKNRHGYVEDHYDEHYTSQWQMQKVPITEQTLKWFQQHDLLFE